MGQPAKANITVTFNIMADSYQKDYKLFEKFIKDANNGELTGEDWAGDYSIHSTGYDEGDKCIDLEVDSGRVQNLDWQLERLETFLKKLDSVKSMDGSAWVMSDYCPSFYRD